MRFLLPLVFVLSAIAQRTVQVCTPDAACTTVDTSRIGSLRFEDYRVTNSSMNLANLEVRRAHLSQFLQATQNLLCTANPNANAILNAPSLRFNAASADISEVESVGSSGQLIQEVYAQIQLTNLVLSDGFFTPSFNFRLSRNRGASLLTLTFAPAGNSVVELTERYALSVDPNTGRVGFPTALPTNAQLLRLVWSLTANLNKILTHATAYKVPNPTPFGRPLFTPDDLRDFANSVSLSVAAYATPSFPPVLEATCEKSPTNSCLAQDELNTFAEALARQGSEYVATKSATPARVLATNLTTWAKANALSKSTPANTAILLRPISLFWPVLQQDSILAASDRDTINAWLLPLTQSAASQDFSVKILDAITRRDNTAFAESVERYYLVLNTLRADGSIPEQAQRGPCALSATNLAISQMMLTAEAAATQGFDLYSLSVNGRSIHTAIEFLLDAYDNYPLLAKYNNPNASCYLNNAAPLERKVFELQPNAASPAAWVEIYLARFPASALAVRLKAKLGLNGLTNRPLASAAAAANTSCLFLTPQELTPVSLPNFDILSGDNQTGPVNSTLPERLAARVRGNAGNPLPNILLNFAIRSGSGTLETTSALTDPFGVATTRLTLGPRSGTIQVSASALGGAPLVFQATAQGNDPKLSPDGIAGVGGSIPSVRTASPGAILSIYGADFVTAGLGRRVRSEELLDNRLPTNFLGVCVYFDTTPAYMLDVYPNQLNIVVPAITGTSTQVRVAKNCGTANEQRTDAQALAVSTAAPEFFSFQPTSSGNNPVTAVDAITGEFFGPLNLFGGTAKPAKPGDYVTLYLTGLGTTLPAVLPGMLATGAAALQSPVTLKLAGQTITEILYAGFSPGSLIYQINFRVPAGLPANQQPISVTVDGQTTPVGAYLTLALR